MVSKIFINSIAMKILCVIGSMSVGGGAERVMSHLASFLSKKHEVTWLALYHCDGPMYHTDPRVKRVNGLGQKNKLDAIIKLRRYIRNENPDVVLSFLTQINISTLLATIFTKTKVVVSDRGNLSVRNKLRKYLRLILYPRAAGRVFQTKDAQSYFTGKIKDDSVVIPNPIFIPQELSNRTPCRRKEVVSVGRLDYQKNHELAINAFANVHFDYPNYKFLIYGDGSEKESLQQLIDKLDMHDVITLCGRKPDVLERIKDAQLFIMASRWEGMPNALMEAMALGIPCISTDCPVGGPRDLITDGVNGFLFENENQKQLEDYIRSILSDPELSEKLGQNAKLIIKDYNIQAISSLWEDYLIKCARLQ